jgi:hypothetical protein
MPRLGEQRTFSGCHNTQSKGALCLRHISVSNLRIRSLESDWRRPVRTQPFMLGLLFGLLCRASFSAAPPQSLHVVDPRAAALQVEVQHFAEKMLHGQNVSAVEFGGAYRAPGAEG